MRRLVSLALVVAMIAAVPGCSTKSGAIVGAGTGGVIGGVIGSRSGNTAVGAILGAAIGGAAGAVIGNYMDDQAEEIERDLEGATVERVGEGIKITFDSGILFDVNRSDLQPQAQTNLANLATILKKYDDTEILIEGHTDADGSEEHNMNLSRSRAQSVANNLAGAQVSATRFTIMGYGESQPIASNESSVGKQQNRRVELAIMANDELKKVAEREAGGGR